MSLNSATVPAGTPRPAAEDLVRHMVETVADAGALAMTKFRTALTSWTKGNNSPVTEADLAVDAFLRERLTAALPDGGWLSEESQDNPERLARRQVWVVDPIDGTRAFMDGGPDWAVSVALVEAGRPVLAALFAPVSAEMLVAVAGRGATRNGQPLRTGGRTRLAGAATAGPVATLDALARVAPIEPRPRIRSLALRLARVATAELDLAFASGNSHDWDIAAADLIVHEAGGRLTTYDGAAPAYNAPDPRHTPLVCAGGTLHATALAAAAPVLAPLSSPRR